MNWEDYPNFSKSEFDCKHTGLNKMKPEFMSKLQELRNKYGEPMKINSGYRHWSHPEEIKKGHKHGEHTQGTCCDVSITNSADRYVFLKLAFEMGFPRIGFHNRFIHIGIGGESLPNNVFWDY